MEENYIVSARKYRPSTFSSVVGQKALTATLRNAIQTGRLAHAYLFCGSRGVGKTTCARIFAKTINCASPTPQGDPCNECPSCRAFNENRSLNIIELDAASNNSVDDIRNLTDQVQIPPTDGRYRVFIVDEVHMLSQAAFNAFLKTLEEPPAHAIFILATTEKHKIIPTILSRCQIYDFKRITIADIIDHLEYVASSEGMTAERQALGVIARKADGAMRDALSIFDQVAASCRGNITYQATVENLNVLDNSYYERLTDAFVAQDVATSLLIYKEIREKGFDSLFFINGLAQYLRDLMVAGNPATLCLLEATDDIRQAMADRASKLHPTFLYKAMDLCNEADFNFRTAGNKQFLIELTLIKLCQLLSPSPDESGSDGGQLRPLESFKTSSPAPQPLEHTQRAASPQGDAALKPTPKPVTPLTVAEPKLSSYSVGGLSLNSAKTIRKQQPEAPRPDKPAEIRMRQYSDADFDSAWSAVTKAFPDEPMLNAVTAVAKPRRLNGDVFKVEVGTPVQADIVQKFMPAIIRVIHDRLANDSVELQVEVCEGDIPPEFWTDQQVLDHLVKDHPIVSQMIVKFKMRLI